MNAPMLKADATAEAAISPLRRVHQRLDYTETCWVKVGTRTFKARALNISEGGICLRLLGLGKLTHGMECELVLEDFGPVPATLRWSKERKLGLEFPTPITGHPLIQRLMRQKNSPSGPSALPKKTIRDLDKDVEATPLTWLEPRKTN